jgi:hypothetical protein
VTAGWALTPARDGRLGTTEAAIKPAVRTLYLKTQTASKHELVLKLLHDVLDELKDRRMDLLL